MTKRTLIIVIGFIFIFLFSNQLEAQCAMCKQAVQSNLDNNPNSIAKNLNTGILYLMAVPYVLIAFIFRKQIATLWRRWRGKETAADTDHL